MKFSERIGIIKAKDVIQIEFINDELRNKLWNAICVHYLDNVKSQYISHSPYSGLFYNLWHNYFKLPLDSINDWYSSTRSNLREWFFNWEWYEVYDFIEYLPSVESPTNSENFIKFCNKILQIENSGYRFINNIISPITNNEEIDEIDKALQNTIDNSMSNVKIHLEDALRKLSDRHNPDYRNSIKESISSIEAICKIITSENKATLGDALGILKNKINLHPALEKGFKQIYGYTSDSNGIRHSLTEDSHCDYEDAKYMLVSCSAFINYLIVKTEKSNVIPLTH